MRELAARAGLQMTPYLAQLVRQTYAQTMEQAEQEAIKSLRRQTALRRVAAHEAAAKYRGVTATGTRFKATLVGKTLGYADTAEVAAKLIDGVVWERITLDHPVIEHAPERVNVSGFNFPAADDYVTQIGEHVRMFRRRYAELCLSHEVEPDPAFQLGDVVAELKTKGVTLCKQCFGDGRPDHK